MIFILTAIIPFTVFQDPPRASLRYKDELIRESRFAYGLSAPTPLFAGQIHQESGWNPEAKSSFASGLSQFTPKTADWISGVYKQLGPSAPTNPSWAIRALLLYDKKLYDEVKVYSSDCDRYQFVLSDYNGGSGRRIRRQQLSSNPGNYPITGRINPGISASNQIENQSYAPKIVYQHQPIYAKWGTKMICMPGVS